MSRKSYMWNRNNSYAYSDPTGYIVCDGCDDEQSQELQDWATDLSAQISAQMAEIKYWLPNDKADYNRLAKFKDDLKWGNASWTVKPGSLKDAWGRTRFSVVPGENDAIDTTFDFAKMEAGTEEDRLEILAREGGTNEIALGNAGMGVQRNFLKAYVAGEHDSDASHTGARITNALYNLPIGLPNVPY